MATKTDPLTELLDAWDKNTGDGRDEDRARQLAKDYLEAYPDQFTGLKGLSVREIVEKIDKLRSVALTFREGELEDEALTADARKLLVDVFILATVPKQHIGGDPDSALTSTARVH